MEEEKRKEDDAFLFVFFFCFLNLQRKMSELIEWYV